MRSHATLTTTAKAGNVKSCIERYVLVRNDVRAISKRDIQVAPLVAKLNTFGRAVDFLRESRPWSRKNLHPLSINQMLIDYTPLV